MTLFITGLLLTAGLWFLLLFLHPALCLATLIQGLLIIHCKRMCIKKSFPICILRKFNLKPCFKILLLSKNENIRVFQHYFHIKSEPQLYQLLRRKLTVSQIKLGQLYKPSYLWSTSRRSLHSVSSHLVCMLLSTKVYQGSFRLGIRKYFFTERVVKDWNSLSWEMLEGFKRCRCGGKMDTF